MGILIVANGHMNLQNKYRKQGLIRIVRLVLTIFSVIVLASANKPFMLAVLSQSKNSGHEPSPVVLQKQRDDSGRTFVDWCREKNSLTSEIKRTVEVLLKEAKTTECDRANQILSTFTELDLTYNLISDIQPLASLTNLTDLDLSDNLISDIQPLTSLTNLTDLDLSDNLITD